MGTLVTFPTRRIPSGPRPVPKGAGAEIIILPVVRYDYSRPADEPGSPACDTTAWPLLR